MSSPMFDAAVGALLLDRPHEVVALRRMGDVFTTLVRPERVAEVFAGRPVPLLGGRSYQQALTEGVSPDVCMDVLRRAFGRTALTEAGAAYLDGPDAEAVVQLAAFGQAR